MTSSIIATFLGPIGEAYDDLIVESGRQVEFMLLASFLLSFLFIRTSARLMRSPKVPWWPGSVKTSGVHVHHLVFGIVMMMLGGFLAFAEQPGSPWIEILAVVFGIGAGLTIDEFALWLYLEDVYWTEEGRSSVDAFIVAALLAGLAFLGFAPLYNDVDTTDVLSTVTSAALVLIVCGITFAKGKLVTGLLGLFFLPVAMYGAIRLARPQSPWARRRYVKRPDKLERAQARDAPWDARRRRWRDVVGGAPSIERGASDR